jgi:transcriptional regulator EpsA
MMSTDSSPPSGALHGDAALLNPDQARAVVGLVEGAPAVRRRYQFFVWTQTQMQALLPHQLLVCGAYQRQRRGLVLDAFHNIVLPAELLQALTDPAGPLLAALLQAWLNGRGQPVAVPLAGLAGDGGAAAPVAQHMLGTLRWTHLLVHASSRPQRLAEVETLFIVSATDLLDVHQRAHRCACLDVLLPHLHSTWQRTVATELELQAGRPPPAGAGGPGAPARAAVVDAPRERGAVTAREQQILQGMREGLSNQAIGALLGISPLTAKNHVQKILRKLQASNRAQAVALALARQLIDAAGTAPANMSTPPRVDRPADDGPPQPA